MALTELTTFEQNVISEEPVAYMLKIGTIGLLLILFVLSLFTVYEIFSLVKNKYKYNDRNEQLYHKNSIEYKINLIEHIISFVVIIILEIVCIKFICAYFEAENKGEQLLKESEVIHTTEEITIYGLYHGTRVDDNIDLTFHSQDGFSEWRAQGNIKEHEILIYETRDENGNIYYPTMNYAVGNVDIIVDNTIESKIVTNHYKREYLGQKEEWTDYDVYITDEMKENYDKSLYMENN